MFTRFGIFVLLLNKRLPCNQETSNPEFHIMTSVRGHLLQQWEIFLKMWFTLTFLHPIRVKCYLDHCGKLQCIGFIRIWNHTGQDHWRVQHTEVLSAYLILTESHLNSSDYARILIWTEEIKKQTIIKYTSQHFQIMDRASEDRFGKKVVTKVFSNTADSDSKSKECKGNPNELSGNNLSVINQWNLDIVCTYSVK